MTKTARGLVLRLLRDAGPMPRAELARRTGLSATTMTKVVGQLIADGCLAEGLSGAPRVGRPATDVALLPEAFWVVGVHAGADGVRLGLRDLLGRAAGGAVPVCGPLIEAIHALVAASGVDPARVLGVGVAAPDRRVADALGVPLGPGAVTGHDACAMALAEARYGCRARDLVYVHVDCGVSVGAVLDGRPFRPADLGHLRVTDDGPPCVCGGTGCLAAVISEPALSARLPGSGGREGLMAAVAADAVLRDQVAAWLATALAAAVTLLRPEHIRLGGLFRTVPDDLLDRIRAALRERTREPVHLDRCGLGRDAGVAGAAALALDRFFYWPD
ncbi:ROK family transcriptional regulator [Nonomuraea endophytica]|uniref:ROK family transcriptional regulator n=1 Tax=Nonomuraea endophytica TaxID=714136 RepID=UPI0037C96563